MVAEVRSAAANPVGCPWVRAAWNCAMAARVVSVIPSLPAGNSPTGATRILAPHPLEEATVASYQGRLRSRFSQARIHVMPGARLLSGLLFQAMKAWRKGPSKLAAL